MSGVTIEHTEARRDVAIAFFRERAGAPTPLPGLHLLIGPTAKQRFGKMMRNVEQGRILPVRMIARLAK